MVMVMMIMFMCKMGRSRGGGRGKVVKNMLLVREEVHLIYEGSLVMRGWRRGRAVMVVGTAEVDLEGCDDIGGGGGGCGC